MKKNKIDLGDVLHISVIVITLTAIIVCVVLKIWVLIKYGEMPITEVPSWAIPFLK